MQCYSIQNAVQSGGRFPPVPLHCIDRRNRMLTQDTMPTITLSLTLTLIPNLTQTLNLILILNLSLILTLKFKIGGVQVDQHMSVIYWISFVFVSDTKISYFSFQLVLHDWCNKGCGMYYPVCGMMHIKNPGC